MTTAPIRTERFPVSTGLRGLAAIAALGLSLGLGACNTDSVETTGSIGDVGAPASALVGWLLSRRLARQLPPG